MDLHAHDLPCAKGELLGDAALDAGAARLPGGGHAHEDEDRLLVDVEVADLDVLVHKRTLSQDLRLADPVLTDGRPFALGGADFYNFYFF